MIPFKINGTRYNVPTEWSDVTFKQYVALLSLPDTLLSKIHLFTGIPLGVLQTAELKNLEKISIALAFLTISPKFEAAPTRLVGPYVMPQDVTIKWLAQFEDLKKLILKVPKKELKEFEVEDHEILADLYLQACAIYCQKVRDTDYNYMKSLEMLDELRGYSCLEIIQTGSFFLFRPVNLSQSTPRRFPNIRQRLKRWIQGLPGYRKTLEFMLPSSGSHEK